MSTPTKTNNRLGVTLTGTPDTGQQVTVEREDTVKKLFGTNIPEVAEGLLAIASRCRNGMRLQTNSQAMMKGCSLTRLLSKLSPVVALSGC